MNSKILVIMIMVVLLLSGCSLEENEKKEEIANINDFPKMYCKCKFRPTGVNISFETV